MRSTLAFVAALALSSTVLLTPRRAEACSCIPTKDAVTSARDADAVFVGTLVQIESPKPAKPHDLPMKVFTFDVERTFKGQIDAQVRVQTTDNSAACGRDYGKVGDGWLIFARIDDQGRLNDNLCSRTKPIADADADIAELEANKDTLDQENPQPGPEGDTTVGPAEGEPEPIEPTEPVGDTGQPEPAEPGKKGCAIEDSSPSPIIGFALLGLLALPWSRSRRGRPS